LKIKVYLVIGLFMFSGSLLYSHERTQNLNLSASGIETLKIDCGAGDLKVQGDDSVQNIEVIAEIVLKGRSEKDAQEYIDKYLRLTLDKNGNRAELTSHFKSKFGMSSWKTKQINLTVVIPADLKLKINDSSGEMRIWDVDGQLEIADGSGSIELEKIGGDVEIDDGSGSIVVRSVRGNVFIEDGSGSISVENVTGNVKIDDGSGSIKVLDVGGDFVLLDDGSGGLSVSGVSGQIKKR